MPQIRASQLVSLEDRFPQIARVDSIGQNATAEEKIDPKVMLVEADAKATWMDLNHRNALDNNAN